MKTYTAYFFTDANYASYDLAAETPEQALAAARALDEADDGSLYFTTYDDAPPVNQIEILDEDGEVAEWLDDDLRLRLAAGDLLAALELCVDCLGDLARLDDGTPSISALNQSRAAIAKAKGGQP
jgi:hypothetical protein